MPTLAQNDTDCPRWSHYEGWCEGFDHECDEFTIGYREPLCDRAACKGECSEPALVAFEITKRVVARMPREDAEDIAHGAGMDTYETVEDVLQRAAGGVEHFDGEVSVEVVADEDLWLYGDLVPVDLDAPTEMLRFAAHYMSKARHQLGKARYREGHCPDVDAASRDLEKVAMRVVKMANALDEERRASAPDQPLRDAGGES